MEMFTWDYLATAAGATSAVTVITQFIKDLPYVKDVPTQAVSYLVSLVVMFAASFFTGILTIDYAALIPLNAVVIMLASNGAYHAVTKKAVKPNEK